MAGNNGKSQGLYLPKEQGLRQKCKGTAGKTDLHDPSERMDANG
jgi:hypothetical protein